MVKNTLYALKLLMTTVPTFLPLAFVSNFAFWFFTSYVQQVLFLKKMLEALTDGGTYRDYMSVLLLFCAGGLAAKFFDSFGDYVTMTGEKSVYKKLNEKIFKKASSADIECFENPEFYDVYKRATEVVTNSYYSQFVYLFAELVTNVVTSVFLIVYVSTVDTKIFVVLIACTASFLIEMSCRKLTFERENAMTLNRRKKAYVQRVVFLRDYAKDLRTSGIYGVMEKNLYDATESNREIITKYGKKIAFRRVVSQLLGDGLPVAGTFVYASYGLITKTLKIADFSVLMTAMTSLKDMIFRFGSDFSKLSLISLYFSNFRKFMNYEPKVVSGGKKAEKIESVEFKNVTFTYPGAKKPSLKNISLKITDEETVAIVGKNGAGKSTFVKLLLRFYDPNEGEILYNGVNVKEYDIVSLRQRIGTVFQDYKVFALTVNENVMCRECETDEDKTASEQALKNSGAYDKIKTLPKGAETVLTKEFDTEGASLSGGEQQKVAAARMFAHSFDMAVLDEPSSALDPIAEYKMYESLIAATEHKTVIYISHRLSSAVLSDKIYVFDGGEIAESGTHDELMSKNGVYAEMFNMQASSYK